MDRPVLFSTPMVLALRARRKTQTRRFANSPLGKAQPGDRLWVREGYCRTDVPGVFRYMADGGAGPFRPSIHMPRAACRLFLTVTEKRYQPLHDITDEDALAEGVVPHTTCGFHVPGVEHWNPDFPILARPTPQEMFAALWDTLHGSGEWGLNPLIVAVTFQVSDAI